MKKTYIFKNRDVDVLEFNVCFEKEMFRDFEKEIAHLINVRILHQLREAENFISKRSQVILNMAIDTQNKLS